MKRQSETEQAPEQKAPKQTPLTAGATISSGYPMSPSPTSSNPVFTPSNQRGKMAVWLLKGVAYGLTAVASALVGATVVLMLPLPNTIAPEGSSKPLSLTELWSKGFGYRITHPVNILVMGIDLPLNLPDNAISDDIFSGRSDTMLLLRIDPDTNSVNVLSIPRDTQVELPEEGLVKINHANTVGGAKLAAQVVSQNLNGVTIDRYVRVSTGAFRELVDLLGGVEVFVPERMEYEDQTQKLKIDLQPGHQVLNGEQAEQFARFRNDDNGDIGRVQRQQQLIRALREKISSPAMLPKLPQAIELFQKYIDTNLSFEEMAALAEFGLGLDRDNFRMVLLPGRFSQPDEYVASYWLIDPTDKDKVMQEYFDVSSVAMLSQRSSPSDLSIAIQNASSDPTLGSDVAAYLEAKGFYNVYLVEDWLDLQQQTQIIVQTGDLESADMLESILGLGQVVPASTGDLQSDLTIRVGNDWAERNRI